jgi:DNA-binding transcriptional MerR regulator
MQSRKFVPASEIELTTGLNKELLRKWRQRYAFPILETGEDGKLGYSRQSISQLLLIKRLIEDGFRPAQIVGKTQQELETLRQTLDNVRPEVGRNEKTQQLLERLKQSDIVGMKILLAQERDKGTLSDFVLGTLAPFISSLGDAWSRNEIEIYHEHLFTSVIQRFLHAEILACKPMEGYPKVLFATPPEERHELGILMTEAVLADHGANTVCVGSHTPLCDLKLAANSCGANVIALSFSFSYPARCVIPTLKHLRFILPDNVEIWAGGGGLSRIRRTSKGIRIFSTIQESIMALHELAKDTVTTTGTPSAPANN